MNSILVKPFRDCSVVTELNFPTHLQCPFFGFAEVKTALGGTFFGYRSFEERKWDHLVKWEVVCILIIPMVERRNAAERNKVSHGKWL